jgi:hypothetical protein
MTAVLVLGAFAVRLTAGVLWAAAPKLQPARGRAAGQTGYAAIGIGVTIYS